MKHIQLFSLLALFAFNASAQNVGIGTSTPSDQLHTTGTMRFEKYKGTNTRLMQIDSSGRLVVTAAGAVASNTTAQAMADNGCAAGNGVTSTILVSGQATAVPSSKIAVRVNITHTFDADLKIFLIPPGGGFVLALADNNGGSADNFINTIFTDLALSSVTTGTAPFTGQYKPSGNSTGCMLTGTVLANFGAIGAGNVVPNGTWTLKIFDNGISDIGTLNNWSISFTGPESITTADENNYIPKFSAGNLIASNIYQSAGNSNIGIGTANPTAKLEVNGTMKITDGTQGIGKVLTSDAAGLVSWATPSGLTLPYIGTVTSTQTLFAISNDGGNSISGYSPGAGTVAVQGAASSGIGISGSANAGTGVNAYSNTGNAGVFQSQTGLAIKTLGGNVEINGKIKMADGTQGANRVLTSDATGLATWVTPPVSAGFSAQKRNGNQTIYNNATDKIDFGTDATNQFGTGYNSTTSQFTAPAAGFYQFNVTLNFASGFGSGTLNPITISLFKGNTFFYSFEFPHTTQMGSQGFSQMMYLYTNEIIDVRVSNQSGAIIQVYGTAGGGIYSAFSGYKVN